MNSKAKFGLSAFTAAAILATAALAQGVGEQAPAQMMTDQNAAPGHMMDGNMGGMMQMMQMMQQMGPMMEACTGMMRAMNDPNGQPEMMPNGG